MNKKWTASLIAAAMIVGLTVWGGVAIKQYVAGSIKQEPSYLTTGSLNADEEEFLSQLSMTREEALFDAQQKVIQIETPIGSIGSGFIYNTEGAIVTNAHVVANASEVTVITADSARYTGYVKGISETTDVAVVQVDELSGKEPMELETENEAQLLDQVLALGSPLGFQNTVTSGVIDGTDRSFVIEPFKYENIDQFTAAISPGNSGGPLLNADTMKVIGLNSAEEPDQNLGYSIPIADVVDLIDGWIAEPMEELPTFDQYAEQPADAVTPTVEEQALYIAQYYLSSIEFGDFVTAYSLLSVSVQQEFTFAEFKDEFQNLLSISLKSSDAFVVSGDVEVRASVEKEELINNKPESTLFDYRFLITEENGQFKIKRLESSVEE
ncbi:S1C family serine protease [Jeotgalibacillus haloalkalitolerans]|uniref:Trypsin-like peptidase domain-containing protein n=1 Tax=Jeotgalibacillus haloalkalitolerans TaxID=3104292 RepID=A0ABU5KQL4_9BACL|nr:trypsin-like peptidase domain-containing protein [Jeotgalibacillus sp. HH7-29]MDZ5713246.1 trypsin-like peptidase domain-containing protein [Jeotgalibacillus sp. HH7-29]